MRRSVLFVWGLIQGFLFACSEPAVTLTGRLVDPRGEPMSGKRLYYRLLGKDFSNELTKVLTDAEGRWMIEIPRTASPLIRIELDDQPPGEIVLPRGDLVLVQFEVEGEYGTLADAPDVLVLPEIVIWEWEMWTEFDGSEFAVTWSWPEREERFPQRPEMGVVVSYVPNRRYEGDAWPLAIRPVPEEERLTFDPRLLGDLGHEVRLVADATSPPLYTTNYEGAERNVVASIQWVSRGRSVPAEGLLRPLGRNAPCLYPWSDGNCPITDGDVSTALVLDCEDGGAEVTVHLEEPTQASSLVLVSKWGPELATSVLLETSEDGESFEAIPANAPYEEPAVLAPPRTVSYIRVRTREGIDPCYLAVSEIFIY